MRTKVLILFIILSSFWVFVPRVSAAQQTLQVAPVITDIQLNKGQSTAFSLFMNNLSDMPVEIHAEVSGLDETSQMVFSDHYLSPLATWTSLTPTDSIIPPHTEKNIQVRITVPKNVKDSGYYETIFLTPSISKTTPLNTPEILSRIGTLVFLTVGKLDYSALAKKVTAEMKPSSYIFEQSPADLTLTVNNNYFTHFKAKPFITVQSLWGEKQTQLIDEKYILPGRNKVWQITAPVHLFSPFYRVHAKISVGQGQQIETATWFIVFPYRSASTIIIAIALLFVLIKYKRANKALRILLGKTEKEVVIKEEEETTIIKRVPKSKKRKIKKKRNKD